jgi:hypothetical protein
LDEGSLESRRADIEIFRSIDGEQRGRMNNDIEQAVVLDHEVVPVSGELSKISWSPGTYVYETMTDLP